MSLRLLHLSDTHLVAPDATRAGPVDTTATLRRALADTAHLRGIELVVLSGDLSDDGTTESYRTLRDLVEPWAAHLGARVVYAMGNHDERTSMRQVLVTRTGAPLDGPLDQVQDVDGLRVVVLDSSVPGRGYGDLDTDQLAWLAAVLRTPARRGTAVVIHHPPVAASTALLHQLELTDPAALGAVLAGSDVRVVLAGHFHHALVDQLVGIPVVVAPAVSNRCDVLAADGHERVLQGSGAMLVTLTAAGVRAEPLTFASDTDGVEIFDLGPEAVARVAEAAGRAADVPAAGRPEAR